MKLFLDLDNTVTQSRGVISPEMRDELSRFKDVHIVSGAERSQIKKQLDGFQCSILAQNGNDNALWKREMTIEEIRLSILHILEYSDIKKDLLEIRGCQIGFSLIGHNAPAKMKKAFDPLGEKRKWILDTYPVDESLEVRIGGTTTMDYFPKGLNKGFNIRKFIGMKGWNKEECLYIGDALFPGGNDETVIGIIPTHQVKNHLETLKFLKTLC